MRRSWGGHAEIREIDAAVTWPRQCSALTTKLKCGASAAAASFFTPRPAGVVAALALASASEPPLSASFASDSDAELYVRAAAGWPVVALASGCRAALPAPSVALAALSPAALAVLVAAGLEPGLAGWAGLAAAVRRGG